VRVRGLGVVGAVLLALSPAAHAEPTPPAAAPSEPGGVRGPLTAVGLSLLGAGVGSLGLGLSGLLLALDAEARLRVYLPAGAPAATDAATVSSLDARLRLQQALAVVGFAAAGGLLLSGVLCLAFDAPRGAALAVVPSQGGWMASLSLRF
jgi:hypothetical protein